VSDVERWDWEDDDGVPDRLPIGFDPDRTGVEVDRHRARGLDLTPEERVARRSNRRWMLGLTISSVVILGAAGIAGIVASGNEPTGPKIAAPPGYHAVDDSYFSYAVPKAWANNPANTDQAGDVETSGPTGLAAEHIDFLRTAPALGETPPLALQVFGAPHPSPFQLTGGHTVSVKGAAVAFSYTATRPGGFRATVIDAYDAPNAVELWLMVVAPPDVTDQVLASLQA
jgi:hypothetical protein